ncbi:MAG: hypothetical protein GY781_11890, partial [Gammaproteobacteria bacterium]|nr:hypothetical protein [Gammaproteobacteria bacterium]
MEEVECVKNLGSNVDMSGYDIIEVCQRVNEGCKVLGACKRVFKCRSLNMNAKKALYEGVIVPTVLYGAEAWGLRVAERRRSNVFEMKCLRSMIGVTRMDRLRIEEVRRKTNVTREVAGRVDMQVLRWFGHMGRMDDGSMTKRVLKAGVTGRGARGRARYGGM